MSKLYSLKNWNRVVRASVADPLLSEPRPNGIACPKCRNELSDTTPNSVLNELPLAKAVHCTHCGWTGKRFV